MQGGGCSFWGHGPNKGRLSRGPGGGWAMQTLPGQSSLKADGRAGTKALGWKRLGYFKKQAAHSDEQLVEGRSRGAPCDPE